MILYSSFLFETYFWELRNRERNVFIKFDVPSVYFKCLGLARQDILKGTFHSHPVSI